MNFKPVIRHALALLAVPFLAASPLTETTAVHTRPDASAPTITFLKAGTAPVFSATPAPSGWVGVDLAGPFEGYVQNKDIGKSLDVRPGSAIHLQPSQDSAILAYMEAGDPAAITGLRGKWTQIRLEKKLTGFIRVAGGLSLAAPAYSAPAQPVLHDVAAASPAPRPVAPAPMTPTAYGAATGGAPAPVVGLNDGGSGVLPRLFQGKFVSSKRPFAPRRPYDWQLNDDAGVRYAYLDLTKLLLTEQIEKYTDRVVVVYGKPKAMPGGRDIVIEVESLQLK
ncbi:MAG: hypothetical protein KF897_12645 [Opitutaceae bacterium]|nr:hypothetical protein [Opitutaceae bacterium]